MTVIQVFFTLNICFACKTSIGVLLSQIIFAVFMECIWNYSRANYMENSHRGNWVKEDTAFCRKVGPHRLGSICSRLHTEKNMRLLVNNIHENILR